MSAAVALGLLLAGNSLTVRRLEWLGEGLRLKARERWAPRPPTGEVVVVAVDLKSLHNISRWPFPRSVHGQLVEWMGQVPETRPSVLSWDILFTEEDYDPRMDAALAAPLAGRAFPVVFGAWFDERASELFVMESGQMRPLPDGAAQEIGLATGRLAALPDRVGGQVPLPELLRHASMAFLNADADEDGVVRRIPLVVRVGERVYPSLVLASAMRHLGVAADAVEIFPGEAVVLRLPGGGERRVPVDAEGTYTLNYRYELRSAGFEQGVREVSYDDLYQALLQRVVVGLDGAVPEVSGKIALVGQTAEGLSDIGPSPLAGQSGKVMVHVNALENILRGDFLRHAPMWPGLVVLLVLGLGLAGVLDARRGVYVVLLPSLLLSFFAGAWALLVLGNVMLPLAAPALAFVAQQVFVTTLKIREEQANRDRIRKMFGSYVSPELVRRMVEARAEPQLGGHEDEITAFFSDIQGFSAFSEVLKPADLVLLLNEYLGAMTDILQERGGALDKYIGDAIVAMFGGLVPLKDHARRACEAAAKMQLRQAELRERWQAQGARWPRLVHHMRTRIGLNSGVVVVGNMGSHHRFNYTMMGDAVNLAARCESGAKAFGAYTVATGETVDRAKAEGCACVFRLLDCIVVKGRSEPAEIYEIAALSAAHLPDGAARCLEWFAQGREFYLKQDWPEARRCFAEAARLEPLQPGRDEGVESNPSLVMLERCDELEAHPPGANWDGVYKMKSK